MILLFEMIQMVEDYKFPTTFMTLLYALTTFSFLDWSVLLHFDGHETKHIVDFMDNEIDEKYLWNHSQHVDDGIFQEDQILSYFWGDGGNVKSPKYHFSL